jgi:hypothetical protein
MKIDGVNVVDAKRKLKITIKPVDIKKGKSKAPESCVIAKACMRQLKAARARVHLSRTYVKIGNAWVRYETSHPLRAEIIAYDRGGRFMPGEFELLVPRPTFREGAKRPSGPRINKTGNRVRTYHILAGIREHAVTNRKTG